MARLLACNEHYRGSHASDDTVYGDTVSFSYVWRRCLGLRHLDLAAFDIERDRSPSRYNRVVTSSERDPRFRQPYPDD